MSFPPDVISARNAFNSAFNCFEAAGDLDGAAQYSYELARTVDQEARDSVDDLHRAASIARSTGNDEQQLMISALLAERMLDLGDDEASYAAFGQAMQIADRNGLPFFTSRLLNDRAQYYFDKGDFMQADNFNGMALPVVRSAGMPWTYARVDIRNARIQLRMEMPNFALGALSNAQEQLRQFPNAALAAEIAELTNAAQHSRARPEDSIYKQASK